MNAAWWWIDRWRKSTAFMRMNCEEQGIYRNLLDSLWLFPGRVIPDEPRVLIQASGASAEEWSRSGARVLQWMQHVDGGWTNETAVEVIDATDRIRGRRSAAGKLGAASRWNGKADGKQDGKGDGKTMPSVSVSVSVSDSVSGSVSEDPPTPLRGKPAAPAGETKPKKTRKRAVADLDAELAFETPWIAECVREWVGYREEKRLGSYTPKGAKALIAHVSEMGEHRTRAAMRHSMQNNYQGLIEPKTNGFHAPAEDQAAERRAALERESRENSVEARQKRIDEGLAKLKAQGVKV